MSLRKYKNGIITTAVVIAASLGGWGVYAVFMENLTAARATEVEVQQKLLTRNAANEIERYYSDAQKRLEIIAQMPSVRNAVRSESCNQELQKMLAVNSAVFNNFGRISVDGTFVCAVNRTIVGEPASKYGTYFDEIAKDPQHKPVFSKLIYPAGSATGVIALHVAVYDAKGNFNGTIGGAVYFEELEKRIVLDKQLTDNSTLAVFDNNGDILYNPDPVLRSKNLLSDDVLQMYAPQQAIKDFTQNIVKGPPSEGVLRFTFKGNPHQSTYKSAQVIGRHWTVQIAVPESDLKQSAQRRLAQQLFVGVTIAFVLAATLFTSTKLRQIKKSRPNTR
jgi:hypothetical protein